MSGRFEAEPRKSLPRLRDAGRKRWSESERPSSNSGPRSKTIISFLLSLGPSIDDVSRGKRQRVPKFLPKEERLREFGAKGRGS